MNAPIHHPIPLLDSDLLRTFVAIAETGSFSAAANTVFRTPSAISMQVKKLEEMLARPVFERDTRSVRLTHDGEVLLGYARRILAINREAMSHFMNSEVSGNIRIGMNEDIGEQILMEFLKRYAQSHPNIAVNLVIDHSIKLHERFARDELDAIVFTCPTHNVPDGAQLLHIEKLVWAGKRGGCAFEKRPLPVSLWEDGCAWRKSALESLGNAGIEPRLAFMSGQTPAQLAAIRADLAIAPLPVSYLTDDIMEITTEHGLPPMGSYGVAIRLKENADEGVLAAFEQIRSLYEHWPQTLDLQ